MTILKIIIIAVIAVVGLTFLTLQKNGANLLQAPGVKERLQVFLTSNTAKTSITHKFGELKPAIYDINEERLYKKILHTATELGWEILSRDDENQNANFVVRTSLFSFEDDVYVQVLFVDANKSSLSVESHSRKGRADFAANSGNIQALLKKLM
ncbi:MAG: DUF1499 domain-containing protein [Gammaproteobacteria bacterium]|nr:DUF1499 domain-containing protein [Gammaproteobacteria bacterium]